MTVLSVVRNLNFIGVARPESLFSSTEREYVQLATLANRAKDDIIAAHDWRVLTKLHTLTGDGTTTEWDFPSDFDRFTDDNTGKAAIVTPIMVGPMVQIEDLQTWLNMEVRQFGRVTYSWILLGGKIVVKPALPAGTPAYFYYQSNAVVQEKPFVFKHEFTLDPDKFRLDEKLLEETIAWMWRHEKRQAYAEDMATAEKTKAQLIMRDKGPRKLKFGSSVEANAATYAYPFALS
jgi:hypothetical protein